MGRETEAEEKHLFDLLFIIIYNQRPGFVVQPNSHYRVFHLSCPIITLNFAH